jgi:hypothetical protein
MDPVMQYGTPYGLLSKWFRDVKDNIESHSFLSVESFSEILWICC